MISEKPANVKVYLKVILVHKIVIQLNERFVNNARSPEVVIRLISITIYLSRTYFFFRTRGPNSF